MQNLNPMRTSFRGSSGPLGKVLPLLLVFTLLSCAKAVPAGDHAAFRGWMELPGDMESGSCGETVFVTHGMTVDGVGTRNYSCRWSFGDRLSLWVAYPLSSWNIGPKCGRTEDWGFDPQLPSDIQSDVTAFFSRGSDGRRYDRGHLMPSASRQGSFANNASTFRSTNISPQNHDFNVNVWQNLESLVREWARGCDTLYVITGCQTQGAVKHVTDRSGNQVTVPTSFYKAVLRYEAAAEEKYCGIGFFFDHEQYGLKENYRRTPSADIALSLAELESVLGYELFAGLGAAVGEETAARIKKRNPEDGPWWRGNSAGKSYITGL